MHAKQRGMVFPTQAKAVSPILWVTLGVALVLPFGVFLRGLLKAWFSDPEFSFGVLIPVIVVYLLWKRREQLQSQVGPGHAGGMALAFVGCGLQVLSGLSGSFLISGIALIITILGAILYLWGLANFKIAGPPVGMLILMIPLPSYVVGELSWRLQGQASTISTVVLRFLGTPVMQDGNLLKLPNYVLEVKQACSGSRSIFALLALAVILGLTATSRWWIRALLVGAAPILAVGANIVRIVGTGLIAKRWGALAADESLHLVWGILVFVIAVSGLLGFLRFFKWAANEHA